MTLMLIAYALVDALTSAAHAFTGMGYGGMAQTYLFLTFLVGSVVAITVNVWKTS